MKNEFSILPLDTMKSEYPMEIRACNKFTSKFGIVLSDTEIDLLAKARWTALEQNGRIEFGGGILQKLIFEFCDSPFLHQDNFTSTIEELQSIFYYFKNECLEKFSDDELIESMKISFDKECQGSTDFLIGVMLKKMSHSSILNYNDRESSDLHYNEQEGEFDEEDKL